jgi:1,6-anhydro-N-acetylmuramate kinase
MPSKIRTELLSMLQQDAAPPSLLSQMDVELGQTFANAVHIFAKRHDITVDDINLIGSGGQLVSLIGRPLKGQHRSNICLGEAAVISANTGVTTVSDYRTTEQAVGRQGAPLFPYLVGLLLNHPTRLQICITIGGITTVCFVPSHADGGIDAMYDWDIGPGTVLIDAAMRVFGQDPLSTPPSLLGGVAYQPIVDKILSTNEYLTTRPPKTTAREIFGDTMAHQIIAACQACKCTPADTIATLTRLTTASIIEQLLHFGPGRAAINDADIVIDGRGLTNPSFISDLHSAFPGANVIDIEARTGVPANAKKAVGFAMQAMEAVLGRALPVPSNADVRRPNTITGKIAPGVGWRNLLEKVVGFGGGVASRGWEGLPEVRELVVVRKDKNGNKGEESY